MSKITEAEINSVGFKLFFPTDNDYYLEIGLGEQLELLIEDDVTVIEHVDHTDDKEKRNVIFSGELDSKEELEIIIESWKEGE